MKHIIKLSVCIALTVITLSCKKDADPIVTHASSEPTHESNKMMMQIHMMMNEMDTMNMTGGPDNHFAKMMRMHHMGAIMMAKSVEAYIEHKEITDLTKAIVETQTEEIALMNSLLQTIN